MKPFAQQSVSFEDVNQMVWHHLEARDWQHNPSRGIATSIALEAAELLEHYQWADEAVGSNDELASELADILIYAFEFAQSQDIDMVAAIKHKLGVAAKKYPAEKFKGQKPEDKHKAWLDAKLHYKKTGL